MEAQARPLAHIKDYPIEVYHESTDEAVGYVRESGSLTDAIGLDRKPILFSDEEAGGLSFRQRKIRVFGHPWHLSHQYSLSKIPFLDWRWLIQYKRPYSEKIREDFMAGRWVPHYEPGEYDVAVLHLDQQCIEPELWERGKGSLYRELDQVIADIPKVVIMHGTTYYPEKFSRGEIVERVREIVGGNTMVTNSNQCARDFGFGTPIVHALDPEDWLDLPKEARAVTVVSAGGLDKYYDREFFEGIRDELAERGIYHCHVTVDWVSKDWDDYRNFLGRSLIFIAPFKDSPMPRARTEAMLSGCCVLTTPWQDAGDFVRHGENGFIIGDAATGVPRNPKDVADLVEKLIENYPLAVAVGREGRKTAIERFGDVRRYHDDWRAVLEGVLNRKISYEC